MRILLLLILALASCGKPEQQRVNNIEAAAEAGPVKGVDRSHKGKPFPDVKFLQDDGDGAGEMTFEPFLGVPTLVNFWASWCAPCVKELPTLKALNDSKKFDGWVLPLSQDSGPQTSVRAFLAKHGVEELGNYQDPKMAVAGALGVQVMPTTILFDAEGREVWRYVGDLDWTSEEAARLLAEASPGKA
jgi:thiol-disulfide isomerase/thioredoxin